MSPVEPSLIQNGMVIRVIRVETQTETVQRTLPFERRAVVDRSVASNETRLLEPGETGMEELTYRITTEDGELVSRTLVRRVILRDPRDEVVLVGGQVDSASVPVTGTVAFLSDRNVWLLRTTSNNQRRLTHSGDLDGRVFHLAPDGSYVLFTRTTTDTVSAKTDEATRPALNSLWLVETTSAGTDPIRLDTDSILWADWGPECVKQTIGNACHIAYTTGTIAPGDPGWRAENDLWVAEPDPRDGRLVDKRRIVNPSSGGAYGWWGSAYAWSPDGNHMAYARADEIGVIALKTGERTALATFPPYRTYAQWVWTPTVSWSPEGSAIIATLHTPAQSDPAPQDSPKFDIWVLALDKSYQVPLVEEAGIWAAPRYSRQGDLIAYGQARSPGVGRTSRYDLTVMDIDGSDRRPVFPSPQDLGLEYPALAWAPSGESLIVIHRGNLHLVSVRDGTMVSLTDGGGATAIDWR